jgi:DNA-binding PadR family transcriptional regulator
MEYGSSVQKYLPLTEATYYIMLSLSNPLHGYGIMQKVEEMTKGSVKLGPGTLYGAINKLLKEDIIREVEDPSGDSRRKCYILTSLGVAIVKGEHNRVTLLYENGYKVISQMGV